MRWLGFTVTLCGLVLAFVAGVALLALPASRDLATCCLVGVGLHQAGSWLMGWASRGPGVTKERA
jgi:hypothetical protein